jgi:hypothetical protein
VLYVSIACVRRLELRSWTDPKDAYSDHRASFVAESCGGYEQGYCGIAISAGWQ